MAILSVLCTTHNHENYIKQAIESVISQTISHELEIIWIDDASTDNTRQVGLSVINSTEITFKSMFREINRYSRRISSLIDSIELASGEYIAFLDGDDFLVSNNYFEQCVDLFATPSFKHDIIFSNAKIVDNQGNLSSERLGYYGERPGVLPFEKVIEYDGGAIPTSTIVARKSKLVSGPHFVLKWPGIDYGIQVHSAYPDGAFYLPVPAGVWRKAATGSWTERMNLTSFRREFEIDFLNLLACMMSYYPQRFRSSFSKVYARHMLNLIETGYIPHQINI
jgi:glycosyltransferase involved in cell wall biosynthesis